MDVINLTGLKVFAHHGVLQEEKENGQEFILDIKLKLDASWAGKNDDLTKTVNYADMAEYAVSIFTEKSYDLIEAAAYNLSRKLLSKYDLIKSLELTVNKPHAPIPLEFTNVSVKVTAGWEQAFIAVGSNMGDSRAIIQSGLESLTKREDIRLIRDSALIETKPYGGVEQPDFVNGMWLIETYLSPKELLKVLNDIEAEHKRVRTIHWGPRTLDLDIIYYGDEIVYSDKLIIPHIDMSNRDFVLNPLKEIAPYKKHPVTQMTAEMMLEKLK